MSARRDDIIAFADELLDVTSYPDFGPVGLQVVGADEVAKIVCGVSASQELFRLASKAGADLVLVHHGLFWDRDPRIVGPVMKGRLEALFEDDLSLVAYHLALDAHPEIGNNALLAKKIGIGETGRFSDVGLGGSLEKSQPIAALAERIATALGREPLVFESGPDSIEQVAVCSGGAAGLIHDAAAEGYDCFVTGEPAEPTKHAASELGIHFVAGGHYATETLGVQALGERIADAFDIEWEFIDLPNPV